MFRDSVIQKKDYSVTITLLDTSTCMLILITQDYCTSSKETSIKLKIGFKEQIQGSHVKAFGPSILRCTSMQWRPLASVRRE